MLRNIPKRGVREARVAQPRSEATKAKRYNHCWVNVRKYSPNITALEKPYTCQDSFMFLYMVILKMIWKNIYTFFPFEIKTIAKKNILKFIKHISTAHKFIEVISQRASGFPSDNFLCLCNVFLKYNKCPKIVITLSARNVEKCFINIFNAKEYFQHDLLVGVSSGS